LECLSCVSKIFGRTFFFTSDWYHHLLLRKKSKKGSHQVLQKNEHIR
jgi:hypothetical protein